MLHYLKKYKPAGSHTDKPLHIGQILCRISLCVTLIGLNLFRWQCHFYFIPEALFKRGFDDVALFVDTSITLIIMLPITILLWYFGFRNFPHRKKILFACVILLLLSDIIGWIGFNFIKPSAIPGPEDGFLGP